MRFKQLSLYFWLVAAKEVTAKITEAPYFYRTDRPIVIAHRGSYGHFPEHSVASYADAFTSGADFTDVDLQVTKDNILVAHHNPDLNHSTDIAHYSHQFADRAAPENGEFLVRDFLFDELA